MINPFVYGGVVGRGSFCNRRRELKDLMRAMENGERLFVFSKRRMGKTSLVRLALDNLPKRGYLGAYVDLWATDGPGSFTTTIARSVAQGLGSTTGRLLISAKEFFGHLMPAVTVAPDGSPQVTFAERASRLDGPTIEEILATPARIARERGCRVVIVLDEFQRILEYEDDSVERILRSVIQNQPEVAYIFLGSRKHLLQEMVLDQNRPLYRSGGHYPLGPISAEHWVPFVRKRFTDSGIRIDDEEIRRVCVLTEGHPFYTQLLCHALWELAFGRKSVEPRLVEKALVILLSREEHVYAALWETLTMNARRVLLALAEESGSTAVYSGDFRKRANLKSSSSVQRAVGTLMERDIIDREGSEVVITDRFFKLWLNRQSCV